MLFVRKNKDAILPKKGSTYAAGYDLFACAGGVIKAHDKLLVPIGWSMRLPSTNMYGRIAARSGIANRHYISVGAGVIDYDYQNEISVLLFNHSHLDFTFEQGERIGQMIIESCYNQFDPTEVESLPPIDSNRMGGFGSTGKTMI